MGTLRVGQVRDSRCRVGVYIALRLMCEEGGCVDVGRGDS
jgi:hypothetical protein